MTKPVMGEMLHWSDNWKWIVICWHAWSSKIIHPTIFHLLLDDWGVDHWFPRIGPRVPLAMVSVFTDLVRLAQKSSDYCHLSVLLILLHSRTRSVDPWSGWCTSCNTKSSSSDEDLHRDLFNGVWLIINRTGDGLRQIRYCVSKSEQRRWGWADRFELSKLPLKVHSLCIGEREGWGFDYRQVRQKTAT